MLLSNCRSRISALLIRCTPSTSSVFMKGTPVLERWKTGTIAAHAAHYSPIRMDYDCRALVANLSHRKSGSHFLLVRLFLSDRSWHDSLLLANWWSALMMIGHANQSLTVHDMFLVWIRDWFDSIIVEAAVDEFICVFRRNAIFVQLRWVSARWNI